jgi:hypothetical protein
MVGVGSDAFLLIERLRAGRVSERRLFVLAV